MITNRERERAEKVLLDHPGRWYCVACWAATADLSSKETELGEIAKQITAIGSSYESDESGRCDVRGAGCRDVVTLVVREAPTRLAERSPR